MVETPLHPHARHLNGKLIGEVFVSLSIDLSQASNAFRLFSERALVAQYSLIALNRSLPLCVVSGV